jgi:hypothetical protein
MGGGAHAIEIGAGCANGGSTYTLMTGCGGGAS